MLMNRKDLSRSERDFKQHLVYHRVEQMNFTPALANKGDRTDVHAMDVEFTSEVTKIETFDQVIAHRGIALRRSTSPSLLSTSINSSSTFALTINTNDDFHCLAFASISSASRDSAVIEV